MDDRSGSSVPGLAHVVLGVDGGGSKTHAVVADMDGYVLGAAVRGPSNWEEIGLPRAADTLERVVNEALDAAHIGGDHVVASVFGLAGVDWESDQERLGNVLGRLRLGGDRLILNDAFVALRAGLSGPEGVVVVAGTGSVVAGRGADGATFRTLGLGPYLGDFGGGSDISERAVQAVAESYLGKGPETALSKLLCEHVRVGTVAEMLEKVSREQDDLPYIVQEVFEVAEQGDQVAAAIIEHAGRELGANANLVSEHLGLAGTAFELVLAGGLFGSPTTILVDPLLATVRSVSPDVVPVRSVPPPVVGAVMLALESMDVPVTGTIGNRIFSGLNETMFLAPPDRL
jgi:N-acetylglucosamine kinase-like BadF-type ATPase